MGKLTNTNDSFNYSKKIIKINEWRSFSTYKYSVSSTTSTGSWSDSPYPQEIAEKELKIITNFLHKNKIKTSIKYIQTGNFSANAEIIVKPNDFKNAKKLLNQEFKNTNFNNTDLNQ